MALIILGGLGLFAGGVATGVALTLLRGLHLIKRGFISR